jgi:hypothetical protein
MTNEREFDSNASQNAFNDEIPKINTTSNNINNIITINNDQSSLIEIAQSNENELSEPVDDDDDELERLRSEALNAKRGKNLNFAQSKIELRKSKHFTCFDNKIRTQIS